MRFVVIPISTRAVYIHCIRHNHPIAISAWPANQAGPKSEYTLNKPNSTNPVLQNSTRSTQSALPTSAIAPNQITIPSSSSAGLVDKLVTKASRLWASFGSSPTQWKQELVKRVNKLLDGIPFGEAALRSVPAKKQVLRKKVGKGMNERCSEKHVNKTCSSHVSYPYLETVVEPIPVYYPFRIISSAQSYSAMRRLAVEGRSFHLRKMVQYLLLLPLTLPLAVLPLIPNVPGFYLVYRVWCSYQALEGAKHLAYLTQTRNGAADFVFEPLEPLDRVYSDAGKTTNGSGTDIKYKSLTRSVGLESNEPDLKDACPGQDSTIANNEDTDLGTMILDKQMAKEIGYLIENDKQSELGRQLVKAVDQTQAKIKKINTIMV